MKSYQYIFWDMDGTIANTYRGVTNCVRYAFEPYGIEFSEDQMRYFIGPPLRESFPKYGHLTPEQTEAAVKRYRERYIPIGVYECELFEGVRETIHAFREAGCIQVIASSKPEAQCREVLKKFDLLEELDEVVGATPDGKIDTKYEVLCEAFRRMKERNPKFSREATVLIGDTHYDVQGAIEAGIDCIGVGYGFGGEEDLRSAGALEVYPDQKTLRDAILQARNSSREA